MQRSVPLQLPELPPDWRPYPWVKICIRTILQSSKIMFFSSCLVQMKPMRPDKFLPHRLVLKHKPFTLMLKEHIFSDDQGYFVSAMTGYFGDNYLVQILPIVEGGEIGVKQRIKALSLRLQTDYVNPNDSKTLLLPERTIKRKNFEALVYQPSIMTLLDTLVDDDTLIKFLQESTLRERTQISARLFKRLLECVRDLHGSGFRHGSISPSSVFVTDSGEIKLGGFSTLSECNPTSSSATSSWARDISDAAGVVMFMLSSKLTVEPALLRSLVDPDLAQILSQPDQPAFQLIPIIESFCGHSDSRYIVQDIRHIASRARKLFALSPRDLPLELRFQYFTYLSMQAVLDIATNRQPAATSVSVKANPFLCSDIATAVISRCEVKTIQRLALANQEFASATWALTKIYQSPAQAKSARSAMEQMAASSPRLSQLRLRCDEEYLIPLPSLTLRSVQVISVRMTPGSFPLPLLSLDPDVVTKVDLCFGCKVAHGANYDITTLTAAMKRLFSPSSPAKSLRIKCDCMCVSPHIAPLIQSVSSKISFVCLADDVWMDVLFKSPIKQMTPQVAARQLSAITQEILGLDANQIRTSYYTFHSWFLGRYNSIMSTEAVESAVSDARCLYPVLDRMQEHRRLRWFKTAFEELELTGSGDGPLHYVPFVLDVYITVARLDIQYLHNELKCHAKDILEFACASILDDADRTDPLPDLGDFGRKLRQLIRRWCGSSDIVPFLKSMASRYTRGGSSCLDELRIRVVAGVECLLEAYECFDSSTTKLIYALELIPEGFDCLLDESMNLLQPPPDRADHDSLKAADMVFLFIMSLPKDKMHKIVNPNAILDGEPLWRRFFSNPPVLRMIVSHPRFDPFIQDSKNNLVVNEFLRHPQLFKPDVLEALVLLLNKPCASGWDHVSFPCQVKNIVAILNNEEILARLALFSRDPKPLIMSDSVAAAARDFPEITLAGVKKFLDMSWSLRFSSPPPEQELREVMDSLYGALLPIYDAESPTYHQMKKIIGAHMVQPNYFSLSCQADGPSRNPK